MEFTTSDGITINYHISGKGANIVFVHGWTMDSSVFSALHDSLGNCRVVSVDMRGHGCSGYREGMDLSFAIMGKDIVELIQYLNLKQPVIAGWSMGVSVILANQRLRDLASKLIFICGTPRFVAVEDFPQGMRPIIANRLRNNLVKDYHGTMQGFYSLIGAGENLEPALKQYMESTFADIHNKVSQTVALQTLDNLYSADFRGELAKVSVPVLLIAGGLDKICSAQALEYCYANMHNARLHIIQGAGHMPFYTKAAECHNLIREFVGV